MMRGEVGAPPRVAGAPLEGCCHSPPLLLYIDMWSSLIEDQEIVLSLPLPADPIFELWLRRSPAEIISPPTSQVVVLLESVRRIHYFRCPAGTRDWKSSPSCTCDRVRRCCPFAALISITISRSASDRLHHPRELFSLTL